MYEHKEMLKRIKMRKKKLNITNESLSKATGIPLGTLNKILSGESKDPQISSIIKISQALDISTDYVVFGKETSSDDSLTEKEQQLIQAYRNHPEMQPAVDKMLDIDNSDKSSNDADVFDNARVVNINMPSISANKN